MNGYSNGKHDTDFEKLAEGRKAKVCARFIYPHSETLKSPNHTNRKTAAAAPLTPNRALMNEWISHERPNLAPRSLDIGKRVSRKSECMCTHEFCIVSHSRPSSTSSFHEWRHRLSGPFLQHHLDHGQFFANHGIQIALQTFRCE